MFQGDAYYCLPNKQILKTGGKHCWANNSLFAIATSTTVLSKHKPIFKPANWQKMNPCQSAQEVADPLPLSYLLTSPLDHPWPNGEGKYYRLRKCMCLLFL